MAHLHFPKRRAILCVFLSFCHLFYFLCEKWFSKKFDKCKPWFQMTLWENCHVWEIAAIPGRLLGEPNSGIDWGLYGQSRRSLKTSIKPWPSDQVPFLNSSLKASLLKLPKHRRDLWSNVWHMFFQTLPASTFWGSWWGVSLVELASLGLVLGRKLSTQNFRTFSESLRILMRSSVEELKSDHAEHSWASA